MIPEESGVMNISDVDAQIAPNWALLAQTWARLGAGMARRDASRSGTPGPPWARLLGIPDSGPNQNTKTTKPPTIYHSSLSPHPRFADDQRYTMLLTKRSRVSAVLRGAQAWPKSVDYEKTVLPGPA